MNLVPLAPEKRILCHCASAPAFAGLLASIAGTAGARTGDDVFVFDGITARFLARATPDALLADLREQYVNLILLDLRASGGASLAAQAASAFQVLDALDRTEDVEGRFAFDRILALLPAAMSPEVDDLVLHLGARGVRHVLRPPPSGPDDGPEVARALLAEVARILRARQKGSRALCASGGGITGIYFELGALKCLDDCLGAGGVNAFDMYFGISAGAVVSSPIAVGYSVDEYLAAIAGHPGGRIAPFDLCLFRLGHVDAQSFVRRVALAARTSAAAVWSALTGRRAKADDELVFDYADLVAAPFRADRFERLLRDVLTAPGATNDFRRLPRPVFIGATDQDARAHVLFGDEEHRDVPVSKAIQASLSINPAFGATLIDGRYYEDGAVTRTSNFVEAIRRGATLILVVDPFVPYVAREPGFANRRGMLYNIDQDVRTISYTRYETTRNWVLRQHPEVSSYTFVPANRLRRLMSINPMDHRPYLEIWRGAYLSTWNRLRALEHRLAGDMAAHGMPFDLARANAVAAQLDRVSRPELADFFPDRNIILKRAPLCLEPAPASAAVAAAHSPAA
ncbi:MAG: patatin-like phospholipase family protein [Myxococcota bacterium]